MFPSSAEKLPILEVADFWSGEIFPRASRTKLLDQLEAAWWRGELKGNLNRLEFLKRMFESRRKPHMQSVVFVSPSDACQPTETWLPDGGVIVRPKIDVPDEVDDWTEHSCNDAFEALANLPSQQYFPLLSYSTYFIDLTPEEFFGWIKKRGFNVPRFWKLDTEVGVMDANRHVGNAPNSHTPSVTNFSGRGTKKRAIQAALKFVFPSGHIPPGMTAEARNEHIFDALRKMGLRSLPNKRTIERAIMELSRSVAKRRE
jgi:hypothetical protein